MDTFSKQFIDFTISHQILKFGEFKTKAGRISPYFFNLGLISNGLGLKKLGEFYGNFILRILKISILPLIEKKSKTMEKGVKLLGIPSVEMF